MPYGDIIHLSQDQGPVIVVDGRCYIRSHLEAVSPEDIPVEYVWDDCTGCGGCCEADRVGVLWTFLASLDCETGVWTDLPTHKECVDVIGTDDPDWVIDCDTKSAMLRKYQECVTCSSSSAAPPPPVNCPTYAVVGAGTAGIDGTYTVTGLDGNGYPYWTSGTGAYLYHMFYGGIGDVWVLHTELSAGPATSSYFVVSADPEPPSGASWTAGGGGTPPSPAVNCVLAPPSSSSSVAASSSSSSSSAGCTDGWYYVEMRLCTDPTCLDCDTAPVYGCLSLTCPLPDCVAFGAGYVHIVNILAGPFATEEECVLPSTSTSSTSSTSSSSSGGGGGGGIFFNYYYCVSQVMVDTPCTCPGLDVANIVSTDCMCMSGYELAQAGGVAECTELLPFGCVRNFIVGGPWSTEIACETAGCWPTESLCNKVLYVACPEPA